MIWLLINEKEDMDYLSSMNSDSQMADSQYIFQAESETGEDYSLHSLGLDSQAGYAQSEAKGQKDPKLESIREEETPFKLQQPQQMPIQQLPINATEFRVQQLSQQLDHLENETQKPQYPPCNGKNTPLSMNNSIQQQISIDKGSKGASSLTLHFKKNLDDMLNRTEKMMEDYKVDICGFIDNHKLRFRKNVEFIRNLLVAETEMIISDEERNRVIDARMQALFNEMVNILNDYQKRK